MNELHLNKLKKMWKLVLTKYFDSKNQIFSVYVDNPFCTLPRCRFCCYKPEIVKNKEIMNLKDKYYDKLLLDEIDDFGEILSLRNPDTFYFGGGSSSIMTLEQMKNVFEKFQKYCDFKNAPKEKTFEMNPSHITDAKIKLLQEWNFTKFSIGAQTFDKKVLKYNNRVNPSIDRLKQIFKLFEGVTPFYNMDLLTFIYKDNPEEDLKILESDLKIATQILKPSKITIFPNYYQLLNKKSLPEIQKKVLNKIIGLRNLLQRYNGGEYKVSKNVYEEVNFKNYRDDYHLFNLKNLTNYVYNCSAWEDIVVHDRIKNQNVLAFGGFKKRAPYSYVKDKFCYHTKQNAEKRVYERYLGIK